MYKKYKKLTKGEREAKARESINKVIDLFGTGNLPEAIAFACNPSCNRPMDKWSFFNKMIVYLSGSVDARGFKQWKEVNRFVKKDTKAICILAPKMIKKEDPKTGEKESICIGFSFVNVYRYEDTQGDELDYNSLEVPNFPLLEVAEKFGVSVKAVSSMDGFIGSFSMKDNEIKIASKDECIFFHELSHAIDTKLRDLKIVQGQQTDREIIAELAAASIAVLVGKKMPDSIGNHYNYIKEYASKANMNVLTACKYFFKHVENILNEIIEHSEVMA